MRTVLALWAQAQTRDILSKEPVALGSSLVLCPRKLPQAKGCIPRLFLTQIQYSLAQVAVVVPPSGPPLTLPLGHLLPGGQVSIHYTVNWKLLTVHCTLYNVHCKTVHCTLYIIHYILYTVHCKTVCRTFYGVLYILLYTVTLTQFNVDDWDYTGCCTVYTIDIILDTLCQTV